MPVLPYSLDMLTFPETSAPGHCPARPRGQVIDIDRDQH